MGNILTYRYSSPQESTLENWEENWVLQIKFLMLSPLAFAIVSNSFIYLFIFLINLKQQILNSRVDCTKKHGSFWGNHNMWETSRRKHWAFQLYLKSSFILTEGFFCGTVRLHSNSKYRSELMKRHLKVARLLSSVSVPVGEVQFGLIPSMTYF